MNMDGHARSPHKTLHVRQALRVDTWHKIHPRTDQRSWWIIMYLIYYTRRSRLQKQKAAQVCLDPRKSGRKGHIGYCSIL